MRNGTDFHSYYASLDTDSKKRIDECSEKCWIQTPQHLIDQNNASDSVYIIEEGVVEVVVETPHLKKAAPLTYLTKGDIIGELGVLNDQDRSATIKATVDVYYRKIEKDNFLNLLRSIPGFGLYIAHRLAERLAATTSNLAYNSFCVDLSGKLPNFDLLSVFSTIEASRVTGELKLINLQKEVIGTFFIGNSHLIHAEYLHLEGIEAVWQLFLEPDIEGAFNFKRTSEPYKGVSQEEAINQPLIDLLMQAAVHRDELAQMSPTLAALKGYLRKKTDTLQWNSVHDEDAANQVWEILSPNPIEMRSLWTCGSLSTFTLCSVLKKLIDTAQVAHSV